MPIILNIAVSPVPLPQDHSAVSKIYNLLKSGYSFQRIYLFAVLAWAHVDHEHILPPPSKYPDITINSIS